MKEVRYFPVVELRAVEENGEKRLKGHAIVFDSDSVDMGFIEQVDSRALDSDLAEVEKGKRNVHAFWNHDSGIPLGSVRGGKLALTKDRNGIAFDLSAKRLTPAQLDAVEDGDMQMSFGFRTRSDKWDHKASPPRRTLLDVELFEISLVSQPAYPDTAVALRSLEAAKQDEVPEPKIESDTTPIEDLKRKLALSMQ